MHSGFWNLNVNSTNQINVLFGDLRNTNIGGSIEYVTIGTAPNRVCIIQWRDYDMFGNPYCHLNAQIRLLKQAIVFNYIMVPMPFLAILENISCGFNWRYRI